MNFDYKENGGKKAFLANPKHQYLVSQCGEHDCCVDIITSIQFCLISWMYFDYTKNGGKKAFLENAKHQYRIS